MSWLLVLDDDPVRLRAFEERRPALGRSQDAPKKSFMRLAPAGWRIELVRYLDERAATRISSTP